jgi:hypothetical protein
MKYGFHFGHASAGLTTAFFALLTGNKFFIFFGLGQICVASLIGLMDYLSERV